ncbi:pyrroline-5-carboxylate reductase [Svornostia abyssi]|uniref:Pyrroline-5-carboxylate reductase n=1 Tax=Svornostia abyssi TaxID=2898438 RepID=A0ABY5PCD5_9ACTN|nr:pyrroline-5-carboxylate reductase [Parviterribacteraceae bacterium J379]
MQIGIIGAGNLGLAFARGLGEPVLVSDADSERARALAAEVGGQAVATNAELAAQADVVVLCHKPPQLEAVAAGIDTVRGGVLSFVGARTVADLRAAYAGIPVVRAMPNTALEVGESVIAVVPPGDGEEAFHAQAVEVMERVGEVVLLPEAQMMLSQISSGAMPAYVALIAEALIDALVRNGLDAETATRLVAGSLPGAAKVVSGADGDTLGVRRAVTSPGGTTAKALAALEAGGVRAAFSEAVDVIAGPAR